MDNVPFTPAHNVFANLIFSYNSFENKIEGYYYSKMSGDLIGLNGLPEYKNINFMNDYKFSQNLTISLNILNIINFKGLKKTAYPIDQRKVLLEFKINY